MNFQTKKAQAMLGRVKASREKKKRAFEAFFKKVLAQRGIRAQQVNSFCCSPYLLDNNRIVPWFEKNRVPSATVCGKNIWFFPGGELKALLDKKGVKWGCSDAEKSYLFYKEVG